MAHRPGGPGAAAHVGGHAALPRPRHARCLAQGVGHPEGCAACAPPRPSSSWRTATCSWRSPGWRNQHQGAKSSAVVVPFVLPTYEAMFFTAPRTVEVRRLRREGRGREAGEVELASVESMISTGTELKFFRSHFSGSGSKTDDDDDGEGRAWTRRYRA